MKILMACSNPWNSTFQVGSHHLAREFIKAGHQIAYISDPISPLHLLKGKELKQRFDLYRSGGIEESSLWSYVPATLLSPNNKPLLRSEWILKNWHRMTFPSLLKKVKDKGFGEVDLLYFDSIVQSFWIDEIKASKTVLRIADKNSGFKKSTPQLVKQEKELIKKVQLVVCSAKTLVDSIQGEASRVEHLPNGVPLSRFSIPRERPPEYLKIGGPIAVYVGMIDYWFDFELIRQVAQSLPHVSFVLIGPVRRDRLEGGNNIHWLGVKPYGEIPPYLQFADVGLIPFDVKNYRELIDHVNPLKLYEYLASGLPVVSTRWKEMVNINSPALLSDTAEQFRDNILFALRNRNGDANRKFTETLDWSYRSKQLMDFLK